MLEQDREKLVNATREMYNRLEANEMWPGPPLHKPNGSPLVHDILERLGLLHLGAGDYEEVFEETTEALRKKMMGAQVPAEEEIPYPTPTTIQSDFSPPESDYADFYSSQPLPSVGVLSSNPYQHTLPAMATNEAIPGGPEPLAMTVTSQPGDGALYPWYQMPSYPATSTPSYNTMPSYGLGLMPESSSPWYPTYNEDLGYQNFGEG